MAGAQHCLLAGRVTVERRKCPILDLGNNPSGEMFFGSESKENSQSLYFRLMISWGQRSEAIGAEVYDRD